MSDLLLRRIEASQLLSACFTVLRLRAVFFYIFMLLYVKYLSNLVTGNLLLIKTK